ncbi:GTP 3',8-cyclase MoaA [Mariniphaga sediminis]|uniref:GTP 3',8-cyclase MoaA n=1 Tax=Mariniphaga sediminis TaxID=1628158 RepID=UPI003564A77D
MLLDQFERIHNYLRISLTDNCNFRCSYCMPLGKIDFLSGEKLMQPHEIENIAKVFVRLGVTKIRLTGGEPLVRNGVEEIIRLLAPLPVELTLTTNGARVRNFIGLFKEAGIRSVNVSLDSLNPDTFIRIAQRDTFRQVWENILLLLENNIRVKLNTVAISGVIEKELFNFIDLTRRLPLHVRFIEFMPFAGNHWNSGKVITAGQMLKMAEQHYDLVKLKDEPHATAKKYKVIGFEGTIAFITTMSKHFCGECNRIRLTADGKVKNCIFGKEEVDILKEYRAGRPIEPLIRESIRGKHKIMGGQFMNGYKKVDPETIKNRSMIRIGG